MNKIRRMPSRDARCIYFDFLEFVYVIQDMLYSCIQDTLSSRALGRVRARARVSYIQAIVALVSKLPLLSRIVGLKAEC